MLRSVSRTAVVCAMFCLITSACDRLAQAAQAKSVNSTLAIAGNDKNNKTERIELWFQSYDEIRHQAQMSPSERERSSGLLAGGIASSLVSSPDAAQDKVAARMLLTKMVNRYKKALATLSAVPEQAETKKLQHGYEQYFHNAQDLFSDYLAIQNNLFATDNNGNGILSQLQQRKADLETLDAANKVLDEKLRDKFKISAYAY